ncbi:MAG: glycosyltransferase family 4 protein [Rhizobium sp.]|nr:glycosyltransferase family 4 protein [Rhizobium sp.]
MLFLTRYPLAGASSRYRVFQYLPLLQAEGLDCTVQSFMDDRLYALSFAPGRTPAKLWHTLKATVRRLWLLRHWRRYDIVYLQRELLPFGPPWVERWLKRRGLRLVFDYDDALFIAKPSRYNRMASFFRAPGKVRELMGMADLVVAGNNWLRDQAMAVGGHAVTVEVAEDTRRFEGIKRDPTAPITIGWLGSTSTVKYLRLVEPTLKALAARHPELGFELMGGGEFEMPGVPWKLLPWSLEGEVDALSRWHIGLMPLPDEDWARGKSGGKARTYMAAGVVPVCTAIGYNLELLGHRHTGMLCSSAEEWQSALDELVTRPDLRETISKAARVEVSKRFAPETIAAQLAALLKGLVSQDSDGARP